MVAFTFLLTNTIRTLQLMFMTDNATGFYYESYEGISNILTLITIVATQVSAASKAVSTILWVLLVFFISVIPMLTADPRYIPHGHRR